MKSKLILIFILLLASCNTPEVSKTKLGFLSSGTSSNHLSYQYSDKEFHYIKHHKLFGGGEYKIKKSELKVKKEFEKGEGESYLIFVHVTLPIKYDKKKL